jgi:hypothetical protein
MQKNHSPKTDENFSIALDDGDGLKNGRKKLYRRPRVYKHEDEPSFDDEYYYGRYDIQENFYEVEEEFND